MKYLKITEFERHNENPFIEEALQSIESHKVAKTKIVHPNGKMAREIQHAVVNTKTGEQVGFGVFMQFIEVDEEKFTKLYTAQLASFWELSKPGLRVFSYILENLKPKSDTITIRMDKCKVYTKYKQKSMIITGLSNLIERGLIARAAYENEYFINPLVFFNGDRITFAKTYMKKKTTTEEPNQLAIFEDALRIQDE